MRVKILKTLTIQVSAHDLSDITSQWKKLKAEIDITGGADTIFNTICAEPVQQDVVRALHAAEVT